jgi:hypothetical protein
MAVDTREKRASAMSLCMPFQNTAWSTGVAGVQSVERLAVTWVYSGIVIISLQKITQDIAWRLLTNSSTQDVAWHIFPESVASLANFLLPLLDSNYTLMGSVRTSVCVGSVKLNYTLGQITSNFAVSRVSNPTIDIQV